MTGQELARAPRLPTLPEKMDYARALAVSNLLPKAYRGQPANVLVAVEYGQSLDLPPMTAIQGVHVIEGKPSPSANLMAALVRREGHKLRVGFDKEQRVGWAEIVRADDPEHTFRCEWDWARADRITDPKTGKKLTSKPNWQNYPEAMLKARAVAEVVKEGAGEVLHGMVYTPDELGVITDEEGAPILDAEVVEDIEPERLVGADKTAGQQEPEPSRHGEPEPVRKHRLTALHAAFGDLNVTDKTAKLAYIYDVIGREIDSTGDLTADECESVIGRIRADVKNQPSEPAEDEPVDAELVDPDEDWAQAVQADQEDPRLYDPANDGALDARMEADTDG